MVRVLARAGSVLPSIAIRRRSLKDLIPLLKAHFGKVFYLRSPLGIDRNKDNDYFEKISRNSAEININPSRSSITDAKNGKYRSTVRLKIFPEKYNYQIIPNYHFQKYLELDWYNARLKKTVL
jgi:hypothetical protein